MPLPLKLFEISDVVLRDDSKGMCPVPFPSKQKVPYQSFEICLERESLTRCAKNGSGTVVFGTGRRYEADAMYGKYI